MSDYSLIYRTVLTVTEGDSGLVDAGGGLWYKEFTIPAVNTGTAKVDAEVAESRIPSLPEPDLTLEHRGAFVQLYSATKLRLYWRGALSVDPEAGQEAISARVEVFDLDTVINEILELDFKLARLLGYLGENVMQDLLEYDDAGNLVQYRLRLFDTKVNAEAATPDRADGSALQTGELARVTMSQDIEISKNDRALLMRVLTDIIATPGV